MTLARLACLTAALAAAPYLCACVSTPLYRTAAEQSADDAIAAGVENTLLRDPRIYARHIDVIADRGVVHLSGLVWSVDDFRVARLDAQSVPGVINVVSELELVRSGRR
jgi:osmotically-inducible protein OsmY